MIDYKGFKEGDIVRVRRDCSGCVTNKDYKLMRLISNDIDDLYASNKELGATYNGCACVSNWILVSRKSDIVDSWLTPNTVDRLLS